MLLLILFNSYVYHLVLLSSNETAECKIVTADKIKNYHAPKLYKFFLFHSTSKRVKGYNLKNKLYIEHYTKSFNNYSRPPNTAPPLTASPNTAADLQVPNSFFLVMYDSLYRRFPIPPFFRQSRERQYWGVDCNW